MSYNENLELLSCLSVQIDDMKAKDVRCQFAKVTRPWISLYSDIQIISEVDIVFQTVSVLSAKDSH